MGMKTACVDFDGVMNEYSGWKGEDELFTPRPGLQEFIVKLFGMYDCLKIHTTRKPELVRAWLEKYGVSKYIADVTNIKPPAVVYIDDRAITFNGDFDATLEQVKTFQAYWDRKPLQCVDLPIDICNLPAGVDAPKI